MKGRKELTEAYSPTKKRKPRLLPSMPVIQNSFGLEKRTGVAGGGNREITEKTGGWTCKKLERKATGRQGKVGPVGGPITIKTRKEENGEKRRGRRGNEKK